MLHYCYDYHSGSAKTLKSIHITLSVRLEKFNYEYNNANQNVQPTDVEKVKSAFDNICIGWEDIYIIEGNLFLPKLKNE